MPWQELTGYLAGICTMLAVVPQISKAWKTRQVEDISVMMLIVLLTGLALWVAYGFQSGAWPIIVTNGLSLLLNALLLGLVFHEKRKRR